MKTTVKNYNHRLQVLAETSPIYYEVRCQIHRFLEHENYALWAHGPLSEALLGKFESKEYPGSIVFENWTYDLDRVIEFLYDMLNEYQIAGFMSDDGSDEGGIASHLYLIPKNWEFPQDLDYEPFCGSNHFKYIAYLDNLGILTTISQNDM